VTSPAEEQELDKTILIVDDDLNVLEVLGARLTSSGFGVLKAESAAEALKFLNQKPVDLMISDIKMPQKDGLALFKEAREIFPELPVFFLTAHGTIPSAVTAVKSGADDYLEKPFDGRELVQRVSRMLENQRSGALSEGEPIARETEFKTKSQKMREIYDRIEKVAASDVNVLITGQSGVGKERVARLVHNMSTRRRKPLVVVDCGATPPNLLESELFGHVKGAFTNAIRDRKGLIESADGGTLFLDEIGNISQEMQVRLLRFLEERRIRKVGDLQEIPVDCRIIAATNSNLKAEMVSGRFREDLYFRLRVVTLELPPLKERKEDIPHLAEQFVDKFARRHNKAPMEVPKETLKWLVSYPWPGNVREMKNALEAAVLFSLGGSLTIDDLKLAGLSEAGAVQLTSDTDTDGAEAFSLEENERMAIVRALEKAGGVQKDAAELLGISRRAIHYKIKKYDIHP
jgi:DNA-binding NtrC family response regulator